MTKQNINVRNLQQYNDSLLYKGFSISVGVYCSDVILEAVNCVCSKTFYCDMLSEILYEIDNIISY